MENKLNKINKIFFKPFNIKLFKFAKRIVWYLKMINFMDYDDQSIKMKVKKTY